MRNIPYDETLDVRFEESWLLRILEPHKADLAEIREAYKLLLKIVELFKQIFPSVDSQLSTHYIDLFALVERNKKIIEDEIYDRYDPNANNGRSLPSDYIHTNIFSDFYKPFATPYDAQAEIEKSNNGWSDILEKMHICYSQINEAYRQLHADKLKRLPNQKLFNTVKTYISASSRKQVSNTRLDCKGVVLDLKRGTVQYKANPQKGVSLDNQGVRLLIMLMKNKGEIVEHRTIAKELQLNFYHENLTNADAGEEIRYLKRNLGSLLKSIGMTDDDFKSFITTQKNVGYKLNCD